MWVVRKKIGIIGERDDCQLHVSASEIESCAAWMLQLLDLNHSRSLPRRVRKLLTPGCDAAPEPV
jgi:hypothetical protein